MVKIGFVIFIVFFLYSCSLIGVFPRERLHIRRSDQSANIEDLKLRVDGMYIFDEALDIGFSRSFFYLFRDGVCYVAGKYKKNAEDVYLYQKQLPQDAPLGWGLYHIKNDSIYIEYWTIIKDNVQYNRAAWKGRIVDNETIVIEKGWTLKDDETVFHFNPLKNKPDSTNRFIK